jgi:hypothetical protein
VVSFTPQPLYPKKRAPGTHWRLFGPQSRSGRGGEEKNPQPLPGLEPPTIHPVARRYTTELFVLDLVFGICVFNCTEPSG